MGFPTNTAPIQPPGDYSVGAYHGALHQLDQWQLAPQQLTRVSLDSDGTLWLEADAAAPKRWLTYTEGTLRSVSPEQDRKIPSLYEKSVRAAPWSHGVVSYRPGRRIVLAHETGSDDVILKGYRKRRGLIAAGNQQLAHKACSSEGFGVPPIIDYNEELELITMARRPGRSPPVSAGCSAVWRSIGEGVRSFQESCESTGLETFTCLDELEVLDELARRFNLCGLDLPSSWNEGREKLGELAAKLPNAQFSAAHRDLHDGQFLAADNGLSLLDFDLLCLADVALDPGNLLAHLFLRDLQNQRLSAFSNARACGRAFLSGLQRNRETGFELRLIFYQASTLYRLALIYALRPRWHHLVQSLVGLGEERLYQVRKYE